MTNSSTSQPATTLSDAQVSTNDRLSFTAFIAIALHALLILGVSFHYSAEPTVPPTFEITLATHKSDKTPEDADFQAQFNQEGSGTLTDPKELTTDKLAPLADTKIREMTPLPEQMASTEQVAEPKEVIRTESNATLQVARRENTLDLENRKQQEGKERDIPLISPEIASLRAKLDRQKQAYAKKPRIRRLTSISTTASADAAYLNEWRQTVERVGNENFPREALSQGIYGQLRMATVLKSDGTIVSNELMSSSGHSILDSAALRIVHLASPFKPFPPEIAKDVDQLEIIRTWRFEITGLTTN
ncbi:energy transducer TonB [Aurantivibrio plasticivorans]